jgi:uncharacterized membrane protein
MAGAGLERHLSRALAQPGTWRFLDFGRVGHFGAGAQSLLVDGRALSGFLVVGPLVATSLYAISRALERGEAVSWQTVRTWSRWQSCGSQAGGYWCLVRFGLLLALAATGWVVVSASLITVLSPVRIATPMDFLQQVVLAPDGRLFTLWLGLGSVLAAPIFASSVVAMPLLLDRRIGVSRRC